MERKPAVAVVFHHIGPYHHARLNAAADKLAVTGIEWSAKPSDAWGSAATPAQYRKTSLFAEATDRYPSKSELQRAFASALGQARPDVVAVNGWNNFGSLIAASCCLRVGIPIIVMSESSRDDAPRAWWKETVKRGIIGLYSAAIVGGQRHIEYLVELGMPVERIFTGYDVVDNDYFRRRTEEVRARKSDIGKQYGLPERYFLASARFIEKKNLPRLIRAYAKYRRKSEIRNQRSTIVDKNSPWDLVILGDGPLRESLNSQVSTLNMNDHVHLPGFKPYDELPVYYALANAFVHASTTEQWGLVVNEAIASGLPVIVSERCGCVPELVQGNGFTFDPTDEHKLAARLLEMASVSDYDREKFGQASWAIAARFGPGCFGEGMEQAAMAAMECPRKRFGMSDRALLLAGVRCGR